MTTISARQLKGSLAKARSLGTVRETFQLGDCAITLRNLRPDEYQQVIREVKELEDVDYLYGFQISHICRAIVEIDGTSFEDIDFVEVEDVDPQTRAPKLDRTGRPVTVNIEVHAFMRDYVISTWTKEAIYVTYRKFSDVVDKAERASAEGINFRVPEETPDEKFRRLLGELKEAEESVPPELANRILEELGFTHRVSQADVAAAEAVLSTLNPERQPTEQAQTAPAPTPEPTMVLPSPSPAPVPVPPTPTVENQALPQGRVPLNRVIQAPPSLPTPPRVTSVEPQLAEVERQPRGTEQIAALEASVDPSILNHGDLPTGPISLRGEVPVLSKEQAFDPKQAMSIVDRPPVAGLNPRYRPTHR